MALVGKFLAGINGKKIALRLAQKTTKSLYTIPRAKLKERISQLCELYGIEFIETEESYTSQASFLDDDFLPTIGEKPKSWNASGKRVKRGIYQTQKGLLVNADINGAANILRKVATTLRFSLKGVSRGTLIMPLRVQFWIA